MFFNQNLCTGHIKISIYQYFHVVQEQLTLGNVKGVDFGDKPKENIPAQAFNLLFWPCTQNLPYVLLNIPINKKNKRSATNQALWAKTQYTDNDSN